MYPTLPFIILAQGAPAKVSMLKWIIDSAGVIPLLVLFAIFVGIVVSIFYFNAAKNPLTKDH